MHRVLVHPPPVASLRLPKGSRIRHASEIRRTFDRGRSSAAGDVVVYAFDRADGRPPRYGLVVGRKWGDAVTRNRVRRLLRESFRTARPDLPAGIDFLLLPRGRLQSRAMPDVRAWLVRAAASAVRRLAEGVTEAAARTARTAAQSPDPARVATPDASAPPGGAAEGA